MIAAWCNVLMAGTQSALDPAGAPADYIHGLWDRTFWTLAIIYLITMLLMIIGALRNRAPVTNNDVLVTRTESDRRYLGVVGAGVFITVVILFVILIGDFAVGNESRALSKESGAMSIEVTGHQWWWEVRYLDPNASNIINDANEIHVMAGMPVRLELRGADVIHSFWVPNLSGKKDLIPGHPTSLTLKPREVGTYWGQCAEFCGYEHAKMRLAFIVQTPEQFKAWAESAKQSAHQPLSEIEKRGMAVFMGRSCSTCHSLQGTPAGGRLGPDLTHIASRATIAAGSLPNSMGHLGGWIIDPQGIKPGVNMPQQQLSPDDLQALLEYLESLK